MTEGQAIEVGFLGLLEVRVDGSTINVPRGASERLLCLLCVAPGQVVRDDVLVDSLWGTTPPKSALFSLRNHVVRLRAILGSSTIERRGDGYRLNPARVTTDYQRFSDLVTDAESRSDREPHTALQLLDEALALVRGDAFLEASDVYHVASVARHIAEQVSAVVEARSALRLSVGDVGADLARFQAAVDADPLREVRWAQLVEALTRSGRRTEALRAAQRARNQLRDVGLSPGADLLAAEARALVDPEPEVHWTPGSVLLEQRRSPLLVGRDAEMLALDPLPTLSWLIGPHGSGKTRLLAELAARERERRITILYTSAQVRTTGLDAISLLAHEFHAVDAVHGALTSTMEVLLGNEASPQRWFQSLPEAHAGRVRSDLVDLAARVLARLEVILLVDDVDELDGEGARLILDLIGLVPAGLRVVVTSSPSSDGTKSLFEHLGHDLPVAATLELQPLDRHAVAALATQGSTGDLGADAIDDLMRLTRGSPQLVLEASRRLQHGGSPAVVPSRLNDIVLDSIWCRTPTERKVLELLATVASPVPSDVISASLSIPDDEIETVLNGLTDAFLVEVSLGDRWSIRRGLVESLVLDLLSHSAVLTHRTRLAEVLRGRSDLRELFADQLLALYEVGQSSSDELGATVLSVIRARMAQSDFGTALRFGERCISLVGLASTDPHALELLLIIGQAMLACGHLHRGKTLIDLVRDRAEMAGDAQLEADAILACGPVETGSRDAADIAARAERVLAALDLDDTGRRVQLACWAAHHRLTLGDRGTAIRLIESVALDASRSDDPVWRSLVMVVAAQAELAVDGSPQRAQQRIEELRAWYGLTNDQSAEAGLAILELTRGFLSGTLEDVGYARDAVHRASLHLVRADLQWIPTAVDAGLTIARGDVANASMMIEKARTIGQQAGAGGAEALAMVHRYLLARLDGSSGYLASMLDPHRDPKPLRRDLVAMWGLACVDDHDANGVRRAATLLQQQPSLLNHLGSFWPVVAMAAAEVAWSARNSELAAGLWTELRPWSGYGLSMLGLIYVGAADTWLGVTAALTGRTRAAISFLEAAVEQETRRGSTPWRQRAEQLLAEVNSSIA